MGDLSQFVNDAVRRRLVELTVSNIKNRNARQDQSEILATIDEEVDAIVEKIGAYVHVLRVPGDKNIPGSEFIRHHYERYGCLAGNCPPSMPVFPSQTD